MKDLKKKGVKFKDGISNNPFGKFATLLDPEGNRLILWEKK
ncbi:bleomycin resistance protein [candidate division TA06 bacterium]|nr:bleomycin resistance protein [candidate division TA06 bacterium]